MLEMFDHQLPSWIPRPLTVFSWDYLTFRKDIFITLLNLENIWSQLMLPFRRLNHSSMHLPFLRVRGRKVPYHSDQMMFHIHHPILQLRTNLLLCLHRHFHQLQQGHPLFRFTLGGRRLMIPMLHQLLHHHILLQVIL